MESLELSVLILISKEGKLHAVKHSHSGRTREPGECVACDELHEFYATDSAGS